MKAVEQSFRGDTVRVFRLNAPVVLGALRRAAARLLDARPEVLEVRLFGSLARNQAVPGSDADLLVIVRATPLPFRERLPEYARYFEGVGIAADLFVYTEAELEQPGVRAFVAQAGADAVSLAGRARS